MSAVSPVQRPVRPLARPSGWCRFATGCDRFLGRCIETIAAVILAVEIALMFAGVLACYIFHAPLTWSDELVSILFTWVALLGAAIAFRRAEHMRMTVMVNRAGPGLRPFFEAVGTAAGIAFLALMLVPAIGYAVHELPIVTDALEISNVWRASALPAGMALMILFGLLRIGRLIGPGQFFLALMPIVVLGLVGFLARPLILAMGNYNLLVFFVGVVGCAIFSGVPIAFAFGLATVAYVGFVTDVPTSLLVGRMEEGMSHLVLLAVPLFIFLGSLIVVTGMASAMVRLLAGLFGHLRGGLHYVLVVAMYLVSGISGSKAADMAAVAPVLFPEMKSRGEKEGELIALLAATGAQTETIPPSIVLITIGSVTSVSIAALFTGGLLPALLLGALLCSVVWWSCRGDDKGKKTPRADWKTVRKAFVVALPALLLPFIIRFAVIEGIATATEVSTIGVAYALVYALVFAALARQRIEWRKLGPALVETASLSGAILLIIGTATAMAWALTQSGFSRQLADAMTHLPGGAAAFMAVSVLAFIVLGSVLEGIPAIVLFGPLLFPVAKELQIHEVHYAIVVVLSMGIGLFAPPFGVGYYSACAISRIDPELGMRPIGRYMLVLTVGIVLIAAFPWLSTGFL